MKWLIRFQWFTSDHMKKPPNHNNENKNDSKVYLWCDIEEEENIKLLDFEEEVDYYKRASKYSAEENIGEIKKIVKLSTCS